MRVCGMSTNAYDNYLTEVKKAGFTVDYEKGSHSYQALNNDGDKIRLYYDGDDQRLSIEIESASYLEKQEKERAEYEKEQKEKEEKETAEQQKADEAAKKKAEEQKQAEEERKKAEEEQKRAEEEQKKAQEEEAGKQQEQNQAQSGGVTPAVKGSHGLLRVLHEQVLRLHGEVQQGGCSCEHAHGLPLDAEGIQ